MRYAIISDIHSNIEALSVFFEKAASLGADDIVCLGDIVGYNANPNECVELVRKNGVKCVMGNHDARAAGVEAADTFSYLAAESVMWTRGVLTEENSAFLASLPRSLYVDNRFLAVHGWINDIDRYIFGAKDAAMNFKLLKEYRKDARLSFFGHTHVALSYIETGTGIVMNVDEELQVTKDAACLVNPGALGQPRDRDPRASFAIYDTKKSLVTFYRMEYDIQTTTEKILKAGLPQRLAEGLKLGW
ncbi:MAG: metallophosphoesterase family protein [Deltaproteobacteria bacterium]|nr:metallophosphoesterase family protein [Deltaproteobacteria bacterium]